jgi:hypothetical protein
MAGQIRYHSEKGNLELINSIMMMRKKYDDERQWCFKNRTKNVQKL